MQLKRELLEFVWARAQKGALDERRKLSRFWTFRPPHFKNGGTD